MNPDPEVRAFWLCKNLLKFWKASHAIYCKLIPFFPITFFSPGVLEHFHSVTIQLGIFREKSRIGRRFDSKSIKCSRYLRSDSPWTRKFVLSLLQLPQFVTTKSCQTLRTLARVNNRADIPVKTNDPTSLNFGNLESVLQKSDPMLKITDTIGFNYFKKFDCDFKSIHSLPGLLTISALNLTFQGLRKCHETNRNSTRLLFN